MRGARRCLAQRGFVANAIQLGYCARVFGRHSRMPDLSLERAPGQKVLVTDALVRRGMLLLGPRSCRVLGGGVGTTTDAVAVASSDAPRSPPTAAVPPPAAGAPSQQTMNDDDGRHVAVQRENEIPLGQPATSAPVGLPAYAEAAAAVDDTSAPLTGADLAALERMVDEEQTELASPELSGGSATQHRCRTLGEVRRATDAPGSVTVEVRGATIAACLNRWRGDFLMFHYAGAKERCNMV